MIMLAAAIVVGLAAAIWALRPLAHGRAEDTRMVVADPSLLAARRVRLRDEQVRLEGDLDLQRGVFEVSSELVGCVDEADLKNRLSSALSRYWRGAALDLLVWERGAWRSLGAGSSGGQPPALGAPVVLPEEGGDLVLDLSPAVDGQAALVLRQAHEQPSIAGLPVAVRRGVAELLRGQFALSLRRVSLFRSLQELARSDPLTGAWRRWYGEARLAELAEGGAPVAVCIADIDHFKLVNDTHGHDIGDQVLKLVAARLAEVGGGGTAYRYGGEEFVVLFPDRGPDHAQPHLERIRASIESYRMAVRSPDRPKLEDRKEAARLRQDRAPDKTLSVTVSIGLAGCSDRKETPAQAMKAADEALYRAKNSGRNRLSR